MSGRDYIWDVFQVSSCNYVLSLRKGSYLTNLGILHFNESWFRGEKRIEIKTKMSIMVIYVLCF